MLSTTQLEPNANGESLRLSLVLREILTFLLSGPRWLA